jgi:membrane-bound lytic murein transglycosylase D
MTIDGPQHLLVPTSKAQLLTASLQTMRPEELISPRSLKPVFEGVDSREVAQLKRAYRVKRGDNLGSIAKANKVEVKDLQRWNKLTGKNLKVGQTLVMQDTTKRSPARSGGRVNTVIAANSKSKASDDSKQTQYKVKRGDTLYVVAKRFNVEMQHLKRWNPGAGKALKPGQMLTVYQPH